MTKVVKVWQTMSFWTKVKGLLATIGVGSEVTLFLADSSHTWKYIAAGATILAVAITHLIGDLNKNGIPDIFEKQTNQQENEPNA